MNRRSVAKQWEKMKRVKVLLGSHKHQVGPTSFQLVLWLTGISSLLDALPSVGNTCSCISWVDYVALVARRTVERLVSILSGAAGLSWKQKCNFFKKRFNDRTLRWTGWCRVLTLKNFLWTIQEPTVTSQPPRFGLHQPVQHCVHHTNHTVREIY